MRKSTTILGALALMLAAALGYLTASGKVSLRQQQKEKPAPTDRSDLPIPDPMFGGTSGKTLADSRPDFPRPVAAPKGAPNVLLILVDDAGFGNPSTFGGPCQTPNLTK